MCHCNISRKKNPLARVLARIMRLIDNDDDDVLFIIIIIIIIIIIKCIKMNAKPETFT